VISFRYHIVSLVSVFLALAVGIALGGGPLKGEVDNTLVEQVQADRQAKADLRADVVEARGSNEFNDEFASVIAPGLVGGTLNNRVVTLAVLPTAPQAEVAGLADMVSSAGGTIGGTVRIGDALLDVENRQLVEELSSQLLESASDVSVPADASGYEQVGALIARAIGTEGSGGANVDGTADSILAGLSTAGLMSAEGDLQRRGDLVLFVAGPGEGSDEERQGANSIATTVVGAVDGATDGTVVAGPIPSARPDGLVRALRDDVTVARDVSTVDVLGRTAAQVVAVMALAGQANDQTGHYGAVDAADGAMPGAVPAAGE
jgi:hypothetical protein